MTGRPYDTDLISGLSIGSVYAMVGLGFVVIYSVCGIINFAHGEYVMAGGMVAAILVRSGVSLPIAILIAIGVAAGVGALSWKIIMDPTEERRTWCSSCSVWV